MEELWVQPLHFDYGEQKQTDVFGTVNGSFSPTTTKLGVSWGTPLYYKGNKLDSVSIGVEGKQSFMIYIQKKLMVCYSMLVFTWMIFGKN